MAKQKTEDGRRTNALKHGAFATEILIFEEDRDEFDQLHIGLVEDLEPSGSLEEELVLDLAKLHWRKRRIEKLYAYQADWLRAHPGEEGIEQLGCIKRLLTKDAPCQDVWKQLQKLPVPMFQAIKALIKPPTKQVDGDWIERLKNVAEFVFLESDKAISHNRNSMRFLGEVGTKLMDLSAKRLAIEERIDAMIDKAFKRLVQLKTYKEVLATQNGGTGRKLSGR